jgi:hypothetical protein
MRAEYLSAKPQLPSKVFLENIIRELDVVVSAGSVVRDDLFHDTLDVG